ncbi:MAG: hypothetical protein RBU37_20825 [Myxococcota bacterium]|jgi:hypothetical protein|nr:hypothetical protein [Myxococcota bacterium]
MTFRPQLLKLDALAGLPDEPSLAEETTFHALPSALRTKIALAILLSLVGLSSVPFLVWQELSWLPALILPALGVGLAVDAWRKLRWPRPILRVSAEGVQLGRGAFRAWSELESVDFIFGGNAVDFSKIPYLSLYALEEQFSEATGDFSMQRVLVDSAYLDDLDAARVQAVIITYLGRYAARKASSPEP